MVKSWDLWVGELYFLLGSLVALVRVSRIRWQGPVAPAWMVLDGLLGGLLEGASNDGVQDRYSIEVVPVKAFLEWKLIGGGVRGDVERKLQL